MRNVMCRRLVLAAAVGACAMAGRGSWGQTAGNPNGAAKGPQLTTLSFSGAALAKPALEYQLLPPAQDVEPGNGAPRYLSALTLLPKDVNDQIEQVDKYLDEPLGQLDEKGAGDLVRKAQPALEDGGDGSRADGGRGLGDECAAGGDSGVAAVAWAAAYSGEFAGIVDSFGYQGASVGGGAGSIADGVRVGAAFG